MTPASRPQPVTLTLSGGRRCLTLGRNKRKASSRVMLPKNMAMSPVSPLSSIPPSVIRRPKILALFAMGARPPTTMTKPVIRWKRTLVILCCCVTWKMNPLVNCGIVLCWVTPLWKSPVIGHVLICAPACRPKRRMLIRLVSTIGVYHKIVHAKGTRKTPTCTGVGKDPVHGTGRRPPEQSPYTTPSCNALRATCKVKVPSYSTQRTKDQPSNNLAI